MLFGKEILRVEYVEFYNKSGIQLIKKVGHLVIMEDGIAFYKVKGATTASAGITIGSLIAAHNWDGEVDFDRLFSEISDAKMKKVLFIRPALEVTLKDEPPVLFLSETGKRGGEKLETACRVIQSKLR